MVQLIKNDGVYMTALEYQTIAIIQKDDKTYYYLPCKELNPKFDNSHKQTVAELIKNRKPKKEICKVLNITQYKLKKLLVEWWGTHVISDIYTKHLGLKYKYQRKKKANGASPLDAETMRKVKEELDNKLENEMATARTSFEGTESNN